jgi:hypothetical protein
LYYVSIVTTYPSTVYAATINAVSVACSSPVRFHAYCSLTGNKLRVKPLVLLRRAPERSDVAYKSGG